MNVNVDRIGQAHWMPAFSRDVSEFWADGLGGQEDELEDVDDGELDAPTDDEGPGEIWESNKGHVALQKADEAGLPSPLIDAAEKPIN